MAKRPTVHASGLTKRFWMDAKDDLPAHSHRGGRKEIAYAQASFFDWQLDRAMVHELVLMLGQHTASSGY